MGWDARKKPEITSCGRRSDACEICNIRLIGILPIGIETFKHLPLNSINVPFKWNFQSTKLGNVGGKWFYLNDINVLFKALYSKL